MREGEDAGSLVCAGNLSWLKLIVSRMFKDVEISHQISRSKGFLSAVVSLSQSKSIMCCCWPVVVLVLHRFLWNKDRNTYFNHLTFRGSSADSTLLTISRNGAISCLWACQWSVWASKPQWKQELGLRVICYPAVSFLTVLLLRLVAHGPHCGLMV